MNALKIRTALVLGFTILSLVGCGSKTTTAPIVLDSTTTTTTTTEEDFTNNPYISDTTDTTVATESEEPAAPEEVATSSTPTTTTPVIVPTPAPVAGSAKIDGLEKSYPGILIMEKVELSYRVRNPYFLKTLKERMVVTFTLKGQIVEVQEMPVELSPAMIKSYTIRSTQHADDGTVAIYAL